MSTHVSRNLAEVERSASEASKIVLKPLDRSEIDRYIAPPADTPFALEYAFHLSGDVRGKTVLDLGCGSGEDVVILAERGAQVVGIDISPDLVAIAQQRIGNANLTATVKVGDAYNTGLPDESVDVIFCIALIHHLDIKVARDEMWRILRKGGTVILKEPIRFSAFYSRVRNMLPAKEDISEYEHPLTQEELSLMTQPFRVDGTRFFRLPFVPLFSRLLPSLSKRAWRASDWVIRHFPPAQAYATAIVTRLQK
jgi:ubiquinone/menaquinone biosynthesis C-methylase UbiE